MQNSVKCARSISSLIKNGINLISNQYDYHEFSVKLSIDEGENVVVLYGQDKSSSTQRRCVLTTSDSVVAIYVCLHAFRVCIE